MMQGAFHPALRDNSLPIIRALPESSGGDGDPQMSPASKSSSNPACFMCTALKCRQRTRQNKANYRVHLLFWSSGEIWKWIFIFFSLLRHLMDFFVIRCYGRTRLFGCLLGERGGFYPPGVK